jgi:hypothetical protein
MGSKVINNYDSFLKFLILKQKINYYTSENNLFFKNIILINKNIKRFKAAHNNFFKKKIISLALRRGLKLKFFNYIGLSFRFFFYLFTHNNLNFFSKYKNVYNVYYSFFNLTNLFFNLNFLLFWLTNIFEPLFTIKCLSVPKKYRKKLKKKFTFTVFFLKKEKRKNVFLK